MTAIRRAVLLSLAALVALPLPARGPQSTIRSVPAVLVLGSGCGGDSQAQPSTLLSPIPEDSSSTIRQGG